MVEISIKISTNALPYEKEKLYITPDAISEFVGTGFSTNAYDGQVIFYCPPRAVDPGWLDIIVDLKDIGEAVIVWGTILNSINKFYKKCKGYDGNISIKRKKKDVEIELNIPLSEINDEENIKRLQKWLKE